MGSVLADLLQQAEAELAGLRARRAELDRADRLGAERVAHLRALVELENGVTQPPGDAPSAPLAGDLPDVVRRVRRNLTGAPSGQSTMRPEDIAAEALTEQGPLHYRELWAEVERRGGVITSGNPAAVLLTRISRDERFAKAKKRGVYKLVLADEAARPKRKRRRKSSRRKAKNSAATPAE